LIVRLLYGCGLRVCEPLNLRIKDVKLQERTLFILGAKGGKDRVVGIPPSVVPELAQQMKRAQAIWLQDKQNRIPVDLPFQLASKYPERSQPTRHPTGDGTHFAGNHHGLPACGKPEREKSAGVPLWFKSPAAGTPGKDASCRTCTSVSKKCMNAPGADCPATINAESTTPPTWVQG
jgi:hypothetical protein